MVPTVSTESVEKNVDKTVTLENDTARNLYKELLKRRLELAESSDCMPYMVASNEALMKMSISKPNDINALRDLKRSSDNDFDACFSC